MKKDRRRFSSLLALLLVLTFVLTPMATHAIDVEVKSGGSGGGSGGGMGIPVYPPLIEQEWKLPDVNKKIILKNADEHYTGAVNFDVTVTVEPYIGIYVPGSMPPSDERPGPIDPIVEQAKEAFTISFSASDPSEPYSITKSYPGDKIENIVKTLMRGIDAQLKAKEDELNKDITPPDPPLYNVGYREIKIEIVESGSNKDLIPIYPDRLTWMVSAGGPSGPYAISVFETSNTFVNEYRGTGDS